MKSWDQPSASSRVVRIVESSKDHPRNNSSRSSDALDMDEILEKICDGTQEIVSPKGSSQYGDKLGKRISASTCGLAALNFARTAFKLEKEENMQGLELLSELLSPKTIEEMTSICDFWKSDSHLEIEELLKVPIFKNTLLLQTCTYSKAKKQHFGDLLGVLEDVSSEFSTIVIITRPPEIVACLRTQIAGRSVYILFDSHPRPSHPDGLGFVINSDIRLAAAYLSDLLAYDENLLNDPSLQWQAQLLGYFSGHILLPLKEEPSTTEMLLESSMALLSSYADVAREKARVSELCEKVNELERQHRFLEERTKHLERRRREDYEQYQKNIDSYVRERKKEHNQASSQERRNFFSSPTSSFLSSLPHVQGGEESWHLIERLRNSKGKQSKKSGSNHGLRSQVQSYASAVSDDGRSDAPLPSTSSWYQNTTIPGGFANLTASTLDSDCDLAVAMELQRKYEEEDEQLTDQREMLQRMEPDPFECLICFDKYPQDSVARAGGCEHQFCRDCLRDHARTKISERRFPISCPSCVADKNRVDHGVVDQNVIQEIGISEEDYQIFEELQITSFCIPLNCRRCVRTMLVDRQELEEMKNITCPWPGCQFVWCKVCQQEIEIGGPQHSCDGSSELRHLMQQQGWKACPGCNTPVQKSEGCNHMTCITPACNTHFCYIDGVMISKGGIRKDIQDALNSHYGKCKLFDYV